MKKLGRRRAWTIYAVAALALLLICVAAGLLPGRQKLPETDAGATNGIRFEQNDELRGRMLRIMARRAAEPPLSEDGEALRLQKLYDGALLCFAEAAKRVWPELDTSSLLGCLIFSDEAEKAEYMNLATRLIGNKCIDKPEDITYWINKETLAELLEQDRQRLQQSIPGQSDGQGKLKRLTSSAAPESA